MSEKLDYQLILQRIEQLEAELSGKIQKNKRESEYFRDFFSSSDSRGFLVAETLKELCRTVCGHPQRCETHNDVIVEFFRTTSGNAPTVQGVNVAFTSTREFSDQLHATARMWTSTKVQKFPEISTNIL
ncbi:hypothetical protein DMENIID0001_104350 [Sergentomyia squamirostris]